MNKIEKKYLRQVRRHLPCGFKVKKQIMEKIGTAVNSYMERHPGTSYGQLLQRFGTPQQVACTYVDEMETTELLCRLNLRGKVLKTVAATCVTAVVLWAIGLLVVTIEFYQGANGYCVFTIVQDEVIEDTYWDIDGEMPE